ncbi:MAG TPA: 3-hydroxyacyl-CoA dehydrogenase NAD-binding domain-containing protein [Candidatus Binatia bacterium]|jgi:3-hydroxyacyl-CoA dehydrogenase|nr:3-hydroxyacyl-CoA dehydrogenase NAD-binding domain-containing protein [Candidatus Binatia bacterium]
MTYEIHKVAVVGAGTMGGGIAAHLANVGIPVLLLDIVPPDLKPEEASDPEARNRIVRSGYDRMARAKPANLASDSRARYIAVGNIEDDLHRLADCDWIIEVIVEQLEPKRALMARIEKVRRTDAIVSSNTSGIPIHEIAEGRSDSFRSHFLGTHFFNPPRYLKLLEVIPTSDTDPSVTEFIVNFGRDVLGKGVVVAKDTPNFIANRFFAITGAYGLEDALEHGYSIEEIDALTGPLIGRPKTGTYRLLDLVGLDVMAHVNDNLYDAIEHDPYRDLLRGEYAPPLISKMMANGWLGNKSDQGFYRKTMVDGERQFWTLDPETMEYTAPEKVRFDSVGAVRKIEDLGERLNELLGHDDRGARYVRRQLFFSLAYAAQVTPEIAYSIKDIDDAMRWGFNHEAGPFEIWDLLGVSETVAAMEDEGFEVAGWVQDMLDAGHEQFYVDRQYYDFNSGEYCPVEPDPRVVLIDELRAAGAEVEGNASASLLDLGDGVALLEFHAKMNAIDQDIVEMTYKALQRLESDFDALVIGNQGDNFSVGANIAMIGIAAAQGMWAQLDETVKTLQTVGYRLRHASKPVVTAPHQRVLGGGVEIAMAGWSSVADHETYMGLVEVGVGLIPAGGGCKELLRRRVNPVMRTDNADVLPVLQEVFEQIALAKVGESAWQDKELGYLRPNDRIVMNGDHRLALAKEEALHLVATGARPPEEEPVFAAGRDALSALTLGVQSFVWGNYASEHDQLIGNKLAYVLCGGDLSAPAWVDPWYILDLEREAFLSLAGEQKTQQRIMHMLQQGKPLRN